MKKILFLAPHLSCKGGIVSVVKNLLRYDNNDFFFILHPVRRDGNKILKILFFFPSVISFIFKLIFTKIDIVHMHVSENYGFFRYIPFMIICNILKKPYILHMHGGSFSVFFTRLKLMLTIIVKKALNRADCIICLSNDMKQYLLSLGLTKLVVIHNATPILEYNHYNPDSKNILYLGKITEQKGIFDLLIAMKNMKKKIDIKLNICGHGDIIKLYSFINMYELNNMVEYKGWVDHGEKAAIMKDAAILVLPSYFEAFPMVLIEAMSYGIPLICTNVGGIPEIIAQENGVLFIPGNIDQLTNSIISLYRNKDQRLQMSNANFLKVNNCYSIDSTFFHLITVYNKIIAKSGCE